MKPIAMVHKYFDTDYEFTLMDSVKTLTEWNIQYFQLFQNVAVCMNAAMCIDLYLSFKNPFYPGGRRMRWYMAGTAVIVVIMLFMEASFLKKPD